VAGLQKASQFRRDVARRIRDNVDCVGTALAGPDVRCRKGRGWAWSAFQSVSRCVVDRTMDGRGLYAP
jgi:hypothetical protein